MKDLDRKSFLKAAGAGSAALAAGAGVPFASRLSHRSDRLTFSAAAGLPRAPLPSYATQIVEGHVDLMRGTGLVTTRVLAGHPGDPSMVGLPGLARVIRVITAESEGERMRLRGVIEDRSQLRRGESPGVEIVIDPKRGLVEAPFLGRRVAHRLTTA